MRKLASILLILAILATPISALADEPQIIMAHPSILVSGLINDAVVSLLTTQRPAETYIYAITYASLWHNGWIASVVGLTDILPPYDNWSLEDGNAVWLGSIVIPYNDPPYYYDPTVQASSGGAKMARLIHPGPGGGANIYLPFQPGKQAMYGVRGVHGSGDFGTSGMVAVDLVGADNMGSGIMPPNVYASADGVIDYVCTDGTSVAVKAYDSTTTNKFIYAHLISNANLTVGYNLKRGVQFANLVKGSFTNTCGWASQSPESYHLHWMFEPASGYFQAEKYTLNTSTGDWSDGSSTIRVLGYLTASGGGSSDYTDGDDPTLPPVIEVDPTDPTKLVLRGGHIWDNMIMGLFSFAGGIASLLPTHEQTMGGGEKPKPVVNDSWTIINKEMKEVIQLAVRDSNLFFGGMVLLGPFIVNASLILFIEAVYIIFALWRLILKIIPAAQ